MKLTALLNKANAGYPDGFLATYYDNETGEKIAGSGDTLAQFIVTELVETFSEDGPGTNEESQIQTAVGTLENAIRDLQATIDALEDNTEDEPKR